MERKHLPADLPTDDGGYALVCTVGRCRWNRKERAQGREGGRGGEHFYCPAPREGGIGAFSFSPFLGIFPRRRPRALQPPIRTVRTNVTFYKHEKVRA